VGLALAAFVLIGLVPIYLGAESHLHSYESEPVALSVGTLQFSNDGHISIRTNVTDLSSLELLQVDGNIGAVDLGACYLDIPADGTGTCLLNGMPLDFVVRAVHS
jgi:hypothetical protein